MTTLLSLLPTLAIVAVVVMTFVLGRYQGATERAVLAGQLSGIAKEVTAQTELALSAERKRDEVIGCIAVIEKERNTWKEMYYKTGLGHSAAQAMLMREIERLLLVCQRAGVKKAEISPEIKRVLGEFEDKCMGPIRAEKSGGIAPGSPAPSALEKPVAGA